MSNQFEHLDAQSDMCALAQVGIHEICFDSFLLAIASDPSNVENNLQGIEILERN